MSGFKLTSALTGAAKRSEQRAAGEAFERELANAFVFAATAGIAWITKRPTPVLITRKSNGVITGRLTGSPGVDYVGALRGGRSIFLEAKRCSEGTLSLDRIEQPQWDEMARVGPLGAARVLIVRWQPPTDKGRALLGGRAVAICVVPWSECESARAAGDASLSAKTLAKYADATGLHWVYRLADVDPLLCVIEGGAR
jgi:hypothetical protein